MTEKLINFIESSSLPTDIATFTVHAFTEISNEKDHLAITIGEISKTDPVLARIHSQCITGESFFSLRCDCRFQLSESLKRIAEKGSGVIFYLQQEGRGIGLSNKIFPNKIAMGEKENYNQDVMLYLEIQLIKGFGFNI